MDMMQINHKEILSENFSNEGKRNKRKVNYQIRSGSGCFPQGMVTSYGMSGRTMY